MIIIILRSPNLKDENEIVSRFVRSVDEKFFLIHTFVINQIHDNSILQEYLMNFSNEIMRA